MALARRGGVRSPLEWQNSTLLQGDAAAEAVPAPKQQDGAPT